MFHGLRKTWKIHYSKALIVFFLLGNIALYSTEKSETKIRQTAAKRSLVSVEIKKEKKGYKRM